MVIKVDKIINESLDLFESPRFVSVDTCCLEDREKVFCHRIVMAVSVFWHGWSIESPGRCGTATPQRLSFSYFPQPAGWYPIQDWLVAMYQSYKLSYRSRIIDRYSTPWLVWMQEISVTHFWFRLSTRNWRFSKFSYLCTCSHTFCYVFSGIPESDQSNPHHVPAVQGAGHKHSSHFGKR